MDELFELEHNLAITSQIDEPTDMGTIKAIATPTIRTIVVDDTKEMAETVSSVLEMNPCVFVVGNAENGLAGLDAAIELQPDLIIMDLNMPVMNGLVATMEIKRRLPAAKVIIMSADDGASTALAAIDAGADAFIPKTRFTQECAWQLRRLFPYIPADERSRNRNDSPQTLLRPVGIENTFADC